MYVKFGYVVSGVYHVGKSGTQVVRLARVYSLAQILMRAMIPLAIYTQDMDSHAFVQCLRMEMLD